MPKLMYLVTEDWYFCSHRLPLACAARDAGYDVVVVTQVTDHAAPIRNAGLRLLPTRFARSGRAPLRDFNTVRAIVGAYREERPDIVHHVSLKPVLYGSLAAAMTGGIRVVNALTGLGHVFTSDAGVARALRGLIAPALRWVLGRPGSVLILQNADDEGLLEHAHVLSSSPRFIVRGSGVDLAGFHPTPEPAGKITVVLAARMLGDKGVVEFVHAAELLKDSGARFVLVGSTDAENPSAIPRSRLEQWSCSGLVEWWGQRADMTEVFRQCHIVCLPSHREGLPKVLVEGAACGRPLVATDVPGCREVVRDGDNGFLVPSRDPRALASALKRLIDDQDLRLRMGRRSRQIAEAEFGIERVIDSTLRIYAELLGDRAPELAMPRQA